MRSYELEMQHPVRHLVLGQLARSLLIQVRGKLARYLCCGTNILGTTIRQLLAFMSALTVALAEVHVAEAAQQVRMKQLKRSMR